MTLQLAPLMSSADNTWNTPRPFIDRLVATLGNVGLDPCSNEHSEVAALREYRYHERGEDGLALPWAGFGLVFCNPPYGRGIGEWMDRCVEGDESVALVPSRTDAQWWQRSAWACDALVLWRGRLSFGLRAAKRNPAPFPSSVFYFGSRAPLFLRGFGGEGFVAKRPTPYPVIAPLKEAA